MALALAAAVVSCSKPEDDNQPDKNKVYTEEWYTGGEMGTAFNATSKAYKQPMPAVTESRELYRQFMRGEVLADKSFVASEDPSIGYTGLGPVYIRKSCIACHPTYGGRSRRRSGQFDSNDNLNGYLLMIYNPETLALVPDYFTGMTQTRAVSPFKAPIDESGITINWHDDYVDEFDNKYADGTPYNAGTEYEGKLQYPMVEVKQDAILFKDFDMSKHAASIEATIGIYGTGLMDAISDEDLRAEYAYQQTRGYAAGVIGADIVDSEEDNPYYPGAHPGRFTYLCTRGSLDNGPGSNALWNITNVTRPSRKYNYITPKYIDAMATDTEVQAALGKTEAEIRTELGSKELKAEMTQADYDAFMVWHRGLAVPAARNLDHPTVKKGKELFAQAGCAACHKPSWTTRANYKPLPAISNQKIWPYTDLLRHDLDMKEPGRAKLCRTTPLWGRGLMQVTSGHGDMLHDLRARTYEEAILWHGGDAKESKKKFREMPKSDRDALVEFLKSI